MIGHQADVGEAVEMPVEDAANVLVGDLGGDLEREPLGDPRHRLVDLQHRGSGRVSETSHDRADGRRRDREYHDGGDDDEDDRHRRGPCAKSDTDSLREEFAVVRRIAEQQLGRLGPLEVQMRGVLPREADATVNLDVFGGRVEVGL